MKNWSTLSKAGLFGLLLFMFFFLLINIGFRRMAQVRYDRLIHDEEVLMAFLEHDVIMQEKVRQRYHLEFQYYESGKMLKNTDPHLPRYQLARILFSPEPNVLLAKGSQALKEMLPYRVVLQGSPWIVLSIFSYQQTKDTGYLVFSPLFP